MRFRVLFFLSVLAFWSCKPRTHNEKGRVFSSTSKRCSLENTRFVFSTSTVTVQMSDGSQSSLSSCNDVCLLNDGPTDAQVRLNSGAEGSLKRNTLVSDFPKSCELPFDFNVPKIPDRQTFESLAFASSGIVKGSAVKFVIDLRNAASPALGFLNSHFQVSGAQPNFVRLHYPFSKKAFGYTGSELEFNNATYLTTSKQFAAATLQLFELNGEAFLGVHFYAEDQIQGRLILDVLRLVKNAVSVANLPIRFVVTGVQQEYSSVLSDVRSEGFDVVQLDDIIGGLDYVAMNQGEAFGRLRLFPKDLDELEPIDIPVFEGLPLELGVVAAVITKGFQDSGSHVNLKSKERGTPNMVLRSASQTRQNLAEYADQFVRLVVGPSGYTLEPSTEAIARKKLADRDASKPTLKLTASTERSIKSFDLMCSGDPKNCHGKGQIYGTKASNLGFLTASSKVAVNTISGSDVVYRGAGMTGSLNDFFGYALVSKGLGVSMQYYLDFVETNPTLKAEISSLLQDLDAKKLSPKDVAARSQKVRELFYSGAFPAQMLSDVRAQLSAVTPGIVKFKVRSSANAEDIPNFDGAGLHDSFAAQLDKTDDDPAKPCHAESSGDAAGSEDGGIEMKPKSLACAIRGVYASLWNKRAIDERVFAHIDNSTAEMGLAIVPKYDLESKIAGNSVVITRVVDAAGLFGYSLSVQKGENLVTNPNPGTLAESSIGAFYDDAKPPAFVVKRFAQPVANEAPLKAQVLPKERMEDLVTVCQTIETIYCNTKPEYNGGKCDSIIYSQSKEKALDLEFKILENGHLVLKQTREFSGR